jgi:hypothetical protein
MSKKPKGEPKEYTTSLFARIRLLYVSVSRPILLCIAISGISLSQNGYCERTVLVRGPDGEVEGKLFENTMTGRFLVTIPYSAPKEAEKEAARAGIDEAERGNPYKPPSTELDFVTFQLPQEYEPFIDYTLHPRYMGLMRFSEVETYPTGGATYGKGYSEADITVDPNSLVVEINRLPHKRKHRPTPADRPLVASIQGKLKGLIWKERYPGSEQRIEKVVDLKEIKLRYEPRGQRQCQRALETFGNSIFGKHDK